MFPTTQSNSTDVAAFVKGAQENTSTQSSSAGVTFLKFSGKTGRWEFGKDDQDFDGEEVMVNSHALKHGFTRWGTKPPAKAHSSIAAPLPTAPAPYDGVDYQGRPCTHMPQDSRIVEGATFNEDGSAGAMFSFETCSMGGVENTKKLVDTILIKAASSPFWYPVVKLDSEFYSRDTGKVYKPVFTVVEWCDVEGNPEDEAPKLKAVEPEPVPEPVAEAPAPKKRRRKAS